LDLCYIVSVLVLLLCLSIYVEVSHTPDTWLKRDNKNNSKSKGSDNSETNQQMRSPQGQAFGSPRKLINSQTLTQHSHFYLLRGVFRLINNILIDHIIFVPMGTPGHPITTCMTNGAAMECTQGAVHREDNLMNHARPCIH
jgi:hypothetical protein